MIQNFRSKPETFFLQKIFLILFGILLCLALIESGLRLGGVIYNAMHPLPKDNGAQYRIFCIGESSTVGVGANDPSLFNYPKQLEIMLNEKFPDLKAQCFYDQGIGVNTTENLLKLPSYLKKYRPHLVIFMVGINNWTNLNKSNVLIFNKNKGLSGIALRLAVFLDQFRIYKLFKMIAYNTGLLEYCTSGKEFPREYGQKLGLDPTSKNYKDEIERLKKAGGDYSKKIFETYGNHIFDQVAFYDLREMVKLCQKQQVKVVISSYHASSETLYEGQKKIASSFHCPFVDNRTLFMALPDRQAYLSYDGWHPNDAGYRFIAENIFEVLLRNYKDRLQGPEVGHKEDLPSFSKVMRR